MEPLESVRTCTSEAKTEAQNFNQGWWIQQWWGAGKHAGEMVKLEKCVQRNMNVLSHSIGVFNSHQLLDLKQSMADVVRGTDAIRRDVRAQSTQLLSLIDQRHSESLVQLQDHRRALSMQHGEAMTALSSLNDGQLALQDQVTAVQRSMSSQLAESHKEILGGLGSLVQGQREMSQQMQHQHETEMHALSLARHDIQSSQMETRENFRRLDPTLTAMSTSIAETKGYLSALVHLQDQQRAADREMQRDLLMAVTWRRPLKQRR